MSGLHTPSGIALGAYTAPAGLVAVGGGTDLTPRAWASRGSGATNGEWMLESTAGQPYRWHAAQGLWLRPEEFGGTPVKTAVITGTVAPASESPAWTDYTSGTGTIASDGTKVTYTQGAGGYAFSYYTHGQTNGNYWAEGLLSCPTLSDAGGDCAQRVFGVLTSTYAALATLSDTAASGEIRFFALDTESPLTSMVFLDLEAAPASEKHLWMRVTGSGAVVYVDHELMPSIGISVTSFSGAAGTKTFDVGCRANTGGNVVTVRDATFGVW